MPHRNIVTRFAPSPTGYLHIGGARTALFNWAFARHHGGTFILRMEDTDVARSTAESTRKIIEDLQWLGLNWDEGPDESAKDVYDTTSQKGSFGPYFQSQRGELYREHLDRLIKAGRAYRCFKSQEQLKAEREAQKAAGAPMKYDPTESLHRGEADQKALIAQGKPFVWRFRMPDAAVTVNDLVLGDVTIQPAELEDFVIMKSEAAGGGPTFHFANVVDDATMQVTHVLRAQEHLMNTPKHVAMFDALGIKRPAYAHMPLIFNVDGTKMSKRDKAKAARAAARKASGNKSTKEIAAEVASWSRIVNEKSGNAVEEPLIIDFLDKKNDDLSAMWPVAGCYSAQLPEIDVYDFRIHGYLPEVVLNYIALLGWNPGGNLPERFDLQWFVGNFDLSGIGKANAKFDRVKLKAFNGEKIASLSSDDYQTRLLESVNFWKTGFDPGNLEDRLLKKDREQIAWFAEAYQRRVQTLRDPISLGRFFLMNDEDVAYDAKAVAKVLAVNNGSGFDLLRKVVPVLDSIPGPWTPHDIHVALEKFAKDHGLNNTGEIAQPLRVAITGTTVSPEIDKTLAILGKGQTLNRIELCLLQQSRA